MAHVSHRLKSSFAGALAGGGDPASSPLYVFGPFLKVIAASAAGAVCFGTPIWMVVATVIVVSLMYRMVMAWITDGSGGSGLCEEELGSWAVRVNAAITVIEYTLTVLVSIAALVTFVADRLPMVGGHWPRIAIAIALSTLTAAVVNRGPKTAARFFGPATFAVIVLLWSLVIATIAQRGLHLPQVRLEAFRAEHLPVTLAGYVRLLALMTGIEVFANLVAAYDGTSQERARKAFGSLLIIMGTTLTAMLVLGPAILELSDPTRTDVSVFTQTMDKLFPAPLAYAGTIVGVVVLLSAAAAAAQGLQNLALGLRRRHYIPAKFGERNRHDVAALPVWLQLIVVCSCFLLLGTREETYLSLYAAGVFVLLSLTALATVKRLARQFARTRTVGLVASLVGVSITGLVTTAAAALIFYERLHEGVWAYAVLVPLLYVAFGRARARLGVPTPIEERLGRVLGENRLPFGGDVLAWPRRILIFIDGSLESDTAVVSGVGLSAHFQAPAYLCLVGPLKDDNLQGYGHTLAQLLVEIPATEVPERIDSIDSAMVAIARVAPDLVIASKDVSSFRSLAKGAVSPVLFLHAHAPASRRHTLFENVLVGLDGSVDAEAVLPYVRVFLQRGARVSLVLVPDGEGESELLERYGKQLAKLLADDGAPNIRVEGSGPTRTLAHLANSEGVDLVVIATHGRGGVARAEHVKLGSVPTSLLDDVSCPLLLVPSRIDAAVKTTEA